MYPRPILLAGILALAVLQPGTTSAPTTAAPTTTTPLDARALTYHRRRTRLGLAGMSTLTTWSLANIDGGTIGNFTTIGSTHYFHQGNALWNGVNLVIAVVGLVNESRRRSREGGGRACPRPIVARVHSGSRRSPRGCDDRGGRRSPR